MNRFLRYLTIFIAFAILCVGIWGSLRSIIAEKFGFGIVFLVLTVAVFIGLLVLQKELGQKTTGTSRRAVHHHDTAAGFLHWRQWTPDQITRSLEAIATILKFRRGKEDAPESGAVLRDAIASQATSDRTLPAAPPPQLEQPKSNGQRRLAVPQRYKVLAREFGTIQDRMGLSADEALRMRVQIFSNADRSSRENQPHRFPLNIDPRVMAARLEFARRIRPYATTRPVRGSSFCSTTASLMAEAYRQPDSRLVRIQIEQTLLTDYTVDELLTWCFYSWELNPREIALLLGTEALSVENAIRDITETLQEIQEQTARLVNTSAGTLLQINISQIYMLACVDWILGSLAA